MYSILRRLLCFLFAIYSIPSPITRPVMNSSVAPHLKYKQNFTLWFLQKLRVQLVVQQVVQLVVLSYSTMVRNQNFYIYHIHNIFWSVQNSFCHNVDLFHKTPHNSNLGILGIHMEFPFQYIWNPWDLVFPQILLKIFKMFFKLTQSNAQNFLKLLFCFSPNSHVQSPHL